LLLVSSLACFLSACDEAPPVKEKAKPVVVKKKIVSAPVPALAVAPSPKPGQSQSGESQKDKNLQPAQKKEKNSLSPPVVQNQKTGSVIAAADNKASEKASPSQQLFKNAFDSQIKHYDSQGKIDPFKPLIQDQNEDNKDTKKGPKRILTPLEKIDLSQIRLVAVIQMKNKRLAMVEEANGKGYEVTIGTYIGRNEGRVTEIKDDRIVIKELVKDFRGRLKEQMQEIQLNKNKDEG
jgi:type IV pilus assembly protein PilP